jgi:ectoine hydroxylase-related dioxygenase (phytanoyl-CoA dioxygenase family)
VSGSTERARAFHERGFVVVKGLLPPATVAACVRELERLSGRTRESFEGFRVRGLPGRRALYRGWTRPDGVSTTPLFRELALDAGLVAVVRELLGHEARYLQHTDLHVGFSAVSWHRDCVNRSFGTSGDWDETQEPYRLARGALYLQSHAESRFALGLVPGSHRRGGTLSNAALLELEHRTLAWRQARDLLLRRDSLAGRAEWVAAEAGDAVIFDPRILHSGSFIAGPKYSAFLAYGIEGRHFTRHAHYYRQLRSELGYRDLDADFALRLRGAGLLAEREAPRLAETSRAYRPGLVQRLLGRRVRQDVMAR